VYNIRAVAVYGGGGKYEMSRALKEQSPEMVIATPGRFIEMVRMQLLSCAELRCGGALLGTEGLVQ
jgi:superfamily II DNA/RNA helicase